MGDSNQLVVPSSSSTSPKQNHVITKSTSTHVSNSTEEGQVEKKANKRHNNRNKGKKKSPNVINATEAGTPNVPEAKSEEQAKKPKRNRKPKVTQDKGSPAAARITKNRAQGRLTEEVKDEGPSQPNKKKASRRTPHHHASSSLPEGNHDMATIFAHELKTSAYECMICMDVVRPAHHIWTCDCCWAMFHLNCVQTWASRSLKGNVKQELCVCVKERNLMFNH